MKATKPFSLLTDFDIYLFRKGEHTRLYLKFGSHPLEVEGQKGTYFAVWAPNADYVAVIGDFNSWDRGKNPLLKREDGSGIWEGFIPDVEKGMLYKYFIAKGSWWAEKGDPFALHWEVPPKTASVVWELNFRWEDDKWMEERHRFNNINSPWCIYEVHIGSWKKGLTYREFADEMVEYIKEIGFTHLELLPVMEHPFYGSWGYQITGYFAPTSRYGTPEDFMYLVNKLHKNNIGIILDWVPSHFPTDLHGLAYFDGTHLYEYPDWRKGWHPDWNSFVFDYGKPEVRSFLLSSAHFWADVYHVDALRVDAVASMLYLDYSRKEGEWIPNIYGGKENLEAIEFIKKLNESLYGDFPHIQTIAEESTAWPMVTRPVYTGGLGFGFKWNMGWMHDTLFYFSKDPIYRKYHHNDITFSIWYAFSENFILPLSHDEVVHGKGSLINKMPGDYWQKFANLRALLAYMWAHPGKKLLFMGGEIGQFDEWNHESSIQWNLLDYESHRGIQRLIKDLNRTLRENPPLYELDCSYDGFEWIDFHDWEKSIISFIRKDNKGNKILVVCNFTPVPRYNYRVGVPEGGFWKEILNTDAREYWGSGMGNMGGKEAEPLPFHGRSHSLELVLPPLAVIYMKKEK